MSAPRPYTCRGCGATVRASQQPTGWYSVRVARSWGRVEPLGLFCSRACLKRAVPRIDEGA